MPKALQNIIFSFKLRSIFYLSSKPPYDSSDCVYSHLQVRCRVTKRKSLYSSPALPGLLSPWFVHLMCFTLYCFLEGDQTMLYIYCGNLHLLSFTSVRLNFNFSDFSLRE